MLTAQLPVRVPSMLIRGDGLLAKPYPMAHNFERLLSASRLASPLSPSLSAATLPSTGGVQQGAPSGNESATGPVDAETRGPADGERQPVKLTWVST